MAFVILEFYHTETFKKLSLLIGWFLIVFILHGQEFRTSSERHCFLFVGIISKYPQNYISFVNMSIDGKKYPSMIYMIVNLFIYEHINDIV